MIECGYILGVFLFGCVNWLVKFCFSWDMIWFVLVLMMRVGVVFGVVIVLEVGFIGVVVVVVVVFFWLDLDFFFCDCLLDIWNWFKFGVVVVVVVVVVVCFFFLKILFEKCKENIVGFYLYNLLWKGS